MGLLSPRRVGVDLGATAVRVVEVTGVDSDGYAMVRRAARVPLRDGAIVAGDIRQPVVLGQALAQALRHAGVPRQGFTLGCSSRLTALGQITAPDGVASHERTQQLRLSRQEISPTVSLADSALSWNSLGSALDDHGRAARQLNVALVQRSVVESLQQVCRAAGAQPQAIDLSAAALLRAIVRCPPDDHIVSTVVDIGASQTIVATRQGTSLRSVRIVPSGGAAVTRAIMGAEELEFDVAETRKQYMQLPYVTRTVPSSDPYSQVVVGDQRVFTRAETAAGSAADQLVEEIAKSIAADASAHQRSSTQGVQLIGGGARLGGLAERLAQRVGVPTVLARPWADFASGRTVVSLGKITGARESSDDPSTLAEFALAVGLALWKTPE